MVNLIICRYQSTILGLTKRLKSFSHSPIRKQIFNPVGSVLGEGVRQNQLVFNAGEEEVSVGVKSGGSVGGKQPTGCVHTPGIHLRVKNS